MDKSLRASLLEALQWAALREVPETNDKDVWICALALVTKKDGSKGYVALRKDSKNESKVVKDFGTISMIAKVEEIYPYLFLDAAFLPVFKGSKKEDRIKWLEANGINEDMEELSAKELNRKILAVAMRNQLHSMQ